MGRGCVREVYKPGTGKLMYVYVAPPTPVGAWSMALEYISGETMALNNMCMYLHM